MTHGLLAALSASEPQPSELERRAAVIERLRRVVASTLGGEATLVGSVASGLATAGADLDFELSGVDASGGALERLRKALVEQGVQRCEVIITRSKAPDLLQYVDGHLSVDCSLRHGSGGQSAGVAKARFVRAHSAQPLVRALQLLVKLWARRRSLVDPTNGRLNSFAWALMVIFYVQAERPALLQPPAEASPEGEGAQDAAFWRWLHGCAAEAAAAAAAEASLLALLEGFYRFWRGFDLTSVASARLGRALPLEQTRLAEAARARLPSADARCYLRPDMPGLMLEDPAEPDENVARTLAETFEWRAELARGAALCCARESAGWAELSAPPAKRRPELAPYLLAGLDGTFPSHLRPRLEEFVAGGGPSRLALPPMDGAQRLALHQLGAGLGVSSRSEGAGGARHVVWCRAAGARRQDGGDGDGDGGEAARASDDEDGGELESAAAPRANPFAMLMREEEEESDEAESDSE